MYFVGVDLAWGKRNGSGLCVLAAGCVVASTRLRTLDEIVEWLMPYVAGDVVVAVDAPLVVRNPSGRRTCETLVSRCFGAHEAAAHSSNLGMPVFADGGRGSDLARRLDLATDPHFAPRRPVRRAVEVYPHTALVALFGLKKTLKYKAKRSRTLADRKSAFGECAELLGRLAGREPALDLANSPAWRDLLVEIRHAPTGAALDRAEDEFDAYICAYIAHYYWMHGLAKCRVIGDHDDGYIVTPVSTEHVRCLDAQVT